jgi:hypothetical protein
MIGAKPFDIPKWRVWLAFKRVKDTAKTRFVRLGTIISVSRKLKPVASSQKHTTS